MYVHPVGPEPAHVEDLRPDELRAEAGHPHGRRLQLAVERLGEADHGVLRGAVHAQEVAGHDAGLGCHVHYVPLAGIHHAWGEGRDAVCHAEDVHVEGPPPFRRRRLQHRPCRAHACVVAQEVHGSVAVPGRVGQSGDGLRIDHVTDHPGD